MLRREFANAVGYLNQIFPEENQLKFIHWDFHKFAKTYVVCFGGAILKVFFVSTNCSLCFSASLPMSWQFWVQLQVKHLT